MASFDHVEWDDTTSEVSSKPESLLEPEADQEGGDGQCALLIRLGGSDYIGRNLLRRVPRGPSSTCRCLGAS